MKKRIILSGVLFLSIIWTTAQIILELAPHEPYHTEVSLRDVEKIEDNFLLKLPLSFNITDKNVLMIMVGGDIILDYQQSVWMFSKELHLSDLIRIDRNVSATRIFRNQNMALHTVLPYHKKMFLYRAFDNGYEIVKKNTKPLLIEILNPAPDEVLHFSLQFYVTRPDEYMPHLFIAKCKPIEIELKIKN